MHTYLSVSDYQRAATGHDTSTLVGNLLQLSAPAPAGSTTLQIAPVVLAEMPTGCRLVLFDGASSESVTLTAPALIGSTTLQTTALAASHVAGTELVSDGKQGSLADLIISASAQLEAYCRQSLLQATYQESLPLRSTSATIDRDARLVIRPRHFPVQSVSALSMRLDAATTVSLSAANCIIAADRQTVTVAPLLDTGAAAFWWLSRLPRTQPGFVDLTYTAGFASQELPADVRQAAIWLVSDLLTDRQNPTGASQISLGKRSMTFSSRQLTDRAYRLLDPYRQRPF